MRLLVAVVAGAMSFAIPAAAETLRGKVVGVTDGDTIRLLVGSRQYKVRLGEIDAPEGGQPYGRAAKRMLSDLVFGQTISARVTDIDRYGRAVAVLNINGLNINAEMVKRGGAWAYRRYLSDQRYLRWEDAARQARRGLWGLQADQIMAPWDWRAAKRRGTSTAITTVPQSLSAGTSNQQGSQCGAKRVCRQMVSCEEALHFLNSCHVRSLDGDGDGVPCEKLCR
jgi:endonuclease YncB( thermonuclease family)